MNVLVADRRSRRAVWAGEHRQACAAEHGVDRRWRKLELVGDAVRFLPQLALEPANRLDDVLAEGISPRAYGTRWARLDRSFSPAMPSSQ